MKLIEFCDTPENKNQLRTLLEEYGEFMFEKLHLVAGKENFFKDLENLPGADYQPPNGSFVLLFDNLKAVGCAALKKWDEKSCELKRMFIRSDYRGLGLGVKLCDWAKQRAKTLGYRRILLDTNVEMEAALLLYIKCGFEQIGPYCLNENAHPVFMQFQFENERNQTER